MKVTFFGVRGSYPCPGADFARYGGNTACVAVEASGQAPVLLDMGTGLMPFGKLHAGDDPFRASALVSHAHWDHIQGLPFLAPIIRPGSQLDVYGPPEEGMSLRDIFDRVVAPPVFPVSWRDLEGTIRFHDVHAGSLAIGDMTVRSVRIPHPGPTLGYRLELRGVVLAYVSDHQMPADRGQVDPDVLSLCRDVDLLIHDAQYTGAEFEEKPHWGHCTVDYAIEVARQAGAARLALFHHDPSHDDESLDKLVDAANRAADAVGVRLFAATEGVSIEIGPPGSGS